MKFIKDLFDTIKQPFLLLGVIYGLLAAQPVHAATIASAVTAGTPLTLLSNANFRVESLTFINTSTNASTLWFYDSTSNSTNYVRGATTTYTLGSTNVSTIFTNSSGIVLTNTTAYFARIPTTVTAATNERPRLLPLAVTPSGSINLDDVGLLPMRGLTVYATQAGTLTVSYEPVR